MAEDPPRSAGATGLCHPNLGPPEDGRVLASAWQPLQPWCGGRGCQLILSAAGVWQACRYIGTAKTALQHVYVAAAMNILRIVHWLDGRPRAKTRVTRFAALARAA